MIDAGIRHWKARLDSFFGLSADNFVVLSRSPGLAMISIEPVRRVFDVPLVHRDDDDHVASAHYLYQDTPEEAWNNRSDYVRRAFVAHVDDPDRLRHLSPPTAMCAHDLRAATIRLVNDFLGIGKIYCYRSPTLDIFATRLAAIPILTGELPSTNEHAWQMQASFDWIVDDSTYLAGISMLGPGSTVTLDANGVEIHDTHSVGRLIELSASKEIAIEVPLAVLQRRFERIARYCRGARPFIGLTGGRDSRLVAALAVTANVRAQYATTYPPELEADLARRLVEAAPRPMEWTAHQRGLAKKPPITSLDRRATSWFAETDGDCWPTFVRNDYPHEVRSRPMLGVPFIAGVGGEILRATFYKVSDASRAEAHIRWMTSFRRGYSSLLKQESRDAATDAMLQVFAGGKDVGLDGLHLLDWFYVRSKMRRRVPVCFQFGKAYPLLDSSAFLAAFHLDPAEKAAFLFQRRLVDELLPCWKEIPYFSDVAPSLPVEQVNKTRSMPYHWESGDRNELLGFLRHALDLSSAVYNPDAIDRYRTINRGDRGAQDLQSGVDKLAWRAGFEAFRQRIAQTLRLVSGQSHFDVVVGDERPR